MALLDHQRVALLDHQRVALLDHLRVALLDHQRVPPVRPRAQALLAAYYYHTLPLLDHQRAALLLDHQRVALLDHQRVPPVHQKAVVPPVRQRAQALLAAYYEKCGEAGLRYEIDEFPDAAEMTV